MPTIPFINAKIFYAGVDLSGKFNQVALEYSAESLDATAFGATTRVMQGGLKVARLTGGGFWDAGAAVSAGVAQLDPTLYDNLPNDDAVLMIFPDAITEGATSTGSGYMCKVTEATYTLGGRIGVILPFTVEIKSRGAGGAQA